MVEAALLLKVLRGLWWLWLVVCMMRRWLQRGGRRRGASTGVRELLSRVGVAGESFDALAHPLRDLLPLGVPRHLVQVAYVLQESHHLRQLVQHGYLRGQVRRVGRLGRREEDREQILTPQLGERGLQFGGEDR